MRLCVLLTCLAAPLGAWEFDPNPVCNLRNDAEPAVALTYDGATYTIALTRAEGWPPAPVFSIRFEGAAPLTISTDRHVTKGPTLSVSDHGFGNVLNGLEFNTQATAIIGTLSVKIDLTNAAGPVREFRACKPAPIA